MCLFGFRHMKLLLVQALIFSDSLWNLYRIHINCKNETGNGKLIIGSKTVALNINVHYSVLPLTVNLIGDDHL
jgi:hypothetical protein